MPSRSLVGIGMQGQRRADRRVAQAEPQDEVAVEPLAGEQPNAPIAVARLVADGVQAAPDVVAPAPAVMKLDLQAQADRVREARQEHRRADPRGVGNGVGVEGGAVADRRTRQRRAREYSAARPPAGTGT